MSTNNSTNLLKAKIEYKKGLLNAENKTTKESIKPVEKKAISSDELKKGRSIFQKLVASITQSLEDDYAHQFAQRKPLASFVKLNTRKGKSNEEGLSA